MLGLISDIDPAWLIVGVILCVVLFDVMFFTLVWSAIFVFVLWTYYVLERDFTTAHAQSATIDAWPYVAAVAFVLGLIGKIFRLWAREKYMKYRRSSAWNNN